MLKKTLLLASASYFIHTHKVYNSPEPKVSMLLRGSYENKIRRFSPPEKIFDVFATIYENGRLYMTLRDLLKAICFYNYSLCDQKDTQGFEPEHILRFLGKNNKFEIYDYFILVRFIAFERQKIQNYFQSNELSEINRDQFISFMKDHVCQDYKDYIKQNLLIESRQFKPNFKSYQQKIELISSQLFDSYGKASYSKKQLINFRKSMINELYQFEFLMFPIKDGYIDGVDFARSIIKYVDLNKTKKFMKRIKQLDGLQQIKINKNSYIGFHTYMLSNIKEIESQLNKKGVISTEQFVKLINSYASKKNNIDIEQLSVITRLLDTDSSGFLEKRQIFGVLKNLEYYTKVKPGDHTFIESLREDFIKLSDKFKRIMQIVQQ